MHRNQKAMICFLAVGCVDCLKLHDKNYFQGIDLSMDMRCALCRSLMTLKNCYLSGFKSVQIETTMWH